MHHHARQHWRRQLALLSLGLLTLVPSAQGASWLLDNLDAITSTAKEVVKSNEVANLSESDELQIGQQVLTKQLEQYPLVNNTAQQRYLNQVGVWVAGQSSRANLPWRFAVVLSEQINAFAVPGGSVLVTSGMLQKVRDEAELACVLGHEVGHIVRRHHLKLLQQGMLTKTGAKLLTNQVQNNMQALVSEAGDLFTRSLDRGSEREADRDGVLLAARAGYDPGACLDFMTQMAASKQDSNALAALYKTHPQASERVQDVREALQNLQGAQAGSGLRPALPTLAGSADAPIPPASASESR